MKKTNKMKKLNKFGTVAGALALMSVMQTTNAFAAVPENANIKVTYDNRTILPDYNGDYAIVIPSGINFTDDKKTDSSYLALTDISGEELTGSGLSISVKVKSENDYVLKAVENKGVDSGLTYTLQAEGNDAIFKNTDREEFATKLGLDEPNKTKIGLNAALTGDTSKTKGDGKYTDTLTFTFTEDAQYVAD